MSSWHEILGWKEQQLGELRTLAFCYARQGIYAVARDLLHMLQVIAPESPYEAQLLGAIYLEEGETKSALYWLDTALRLDPNHQITQLNQVKALLQSGEAVRGLALAEMLRSSVNKAVVNDAEALILAYRRAA